VSWPNYVLTRVVTGNYVTASGSPASGRVTFTPTSRVIDENNAVIVEDSISAVLDVNGAFSVTLPATDNTSLNPVDWAYEVSVRIYGSRPRKFFASLPYGDGSAVNLNNEINTQPTPVTSSPFANYTIEPEQSGTPGVWPSDVVTRAITATYLTATGVAAKGRVTFTPTTRVVDERDSVLIEDTITATLNANGSISLSLPTTDNTLLKPENWAYEVNVRLYGVKPLKFFILLPYGDGSAVDLINSVSTVSTTIADSTIQGSTLQGPVGPRGPGTIVGAGPPSNLVGFDGDIYIDEDPGEYYGPKAAGAWPASPFFSISGFSNTTQRHVHTQGAASSTWTITHALGGNPSVMVVDSSNTVVYGEIQYLSSTQVRILFSAAFSGFAYLT
jgi:hypothetical protein